MAVEVSVIIPVYNQERDLSAFHLRLSTTLRRLAIPYEIIYVDDGSTDRSADLLTDLQADDSSVKGIMLSRHFGRQAAVYAGLEAAGGRAVITLGGDLHDPPEVIPQLIDKWLSGHQVVIARPKWSRKKTLRRGLRFVFQVVLRRFSGLSILLDDHHFTLMDRRVVDQLINLFDRVGLIHGLRSWIGFKHGEVEYGGDPKQYSRSKLTFTHLVRNLVDNLIAFSDAPLKAVALAGCLVILLAMIGMFFATTIGAMVSFPMTGVVYLGACLVFIGGIQLLGLGIIGAYISRICRETRSLPPYVTRKRVGFHPNLRHVPNVLEFLPTESARRQEKATVSRLDSDTYEDLELNDIHN